MASTRFLNMSMPLVDLVFITNLAFISAGTFLLATQYVQIFVVVSITLFVGLNNHVKRQNNLSNKDFSTSLLLGVIAGLVFTGIALILVGLVYQDRYVFISSIYLILGLLPLFIYMAILTFLESVEEESKLKNISMFSIVINATLNIVLIQFIEQPSIAIIVATSIVRLVMLLQILYLALRLGYKITYDIDYSLIRKVLVIGVPEVLSRLLFVCLMYIVVVLVSKQLVTKEFADFAVVLTYMNIAFAVGMSISVALTTTYSQDLIEKRTHKIYFRSLILPTIIYLGICLIFAPIYSLINGSGVRLVELLCIGAIAIVIDILSMGLIAYLRINNMVRYPPYSRLSLFAFIIMYIHFSSPITLSGVLTAFVFGNIIVLSILIILCTVVYNTMYKDISCVSNSVAPPNE